MYVSTHKPCRHVFDTKSEYLWQQPLSIDEKDCLMTLPIDGNLFPFAICDPHQINDTVTLLGQESVKHFYF